MFLKKMMSSIVTTDDQSELKVSFKGKIRRISTETMVKENQTMHDYQWIYKPIEYRLTEKLKQVIEMLQQLSINIEEDEEIQEGIARDLCIELEKIREVAG